MSIRNLGGDPEVVARVRPVIHRPDRQRLTLMLINNAIAVGNAVLLTEAIATAATLGVECVIYMR